MKTPLDIATKDFQNLFDFKILGMTEVVDVILKFIFEIIPT
ncbi:hypothetical protein JM83_1352 [Gillisia sp. Hel_I_86]|nr:hypothetical protein JM83_1352 [Gillisia sp. Hel_I_86]